MICISSEGIIDKNEILECHFENGSEIDQSLIELLLINQRHKYLVSDEHKLVQTLNFQKRLIFMRL